MSQNLTKKNDHQDAEKSSKIILIQGFGFMSLVIIMMASVWFYMINQTQSQIDEIVAEQEKGKAVFTMRDAAHQRALILHRMALMEDEFDRADEYLLFKEKAADFLRSRDIFLARAKADNNSDELAIWEEIAADLRKGGNWQSTTAEFLQDGENEKAIDTLLNVAVPIQTKVMGNLTNLLNTQSQKSKSNVENISKQTNTSLVAMLGLAGWAVIWTFLIGSHTIKRTSLVEKSLREAREKAQNADKHKSQFLANMSHEIRTPLAAIIGYSETLLDGKDNSEEENLYLGNIIRNGNHLNQLINDILDMSKIEANQLTIEKIPVSPTQILTEIDTLMGERAREKGLSFEVNCQYPIPKTINCDPTRLKQILINLCGNAIKFTPNGKVSVQVSYDNKCNLMVFNVEDSGIGMNPKQIAELFKPFVQADSTTTRKFGGTGLGLYISKQLADKLGGYLDVESSEGSGSRFTVSVDAGEISQQGWIYTKEEAKAYITTISKKPIVPSLKGKILLAEDNIDNQQLISLQIRNTGAEVTVVENGKLAVEHALSNPYDLILMDMQMPVMGGIEAIKTLRENGCTIPIVTLTANAMNEDRKQSEQAGSSEFLTKPIDRHVFYSTLQKYLEEANQTEENQSIQFRIKSNPDLEGFEDLIEKYIHRLPETMSRIDRLIASKDWTGVKSEIHQLKGTGSSFGFPEITGQCVVIEKFLKSEEYDRAITQILELKNFCDSISPQNTAAVA